MKRMELVNDISDVALDIMTATTQGEACSAAQRLRALASAAERMAETLPVENPYAVIPSEEQDFAA